MLRFNQLIDQPGGRDKPTTFLLLTGRHTQPRRQMRLAGAAVADEDDGFSRLEITAFRQLVHQLRLDMRRRTKVKLIERLEPWQTRFFEVPLDGVAFAFINFGTQLLRQIANVGLIAL